MSRYSNNKKRSFLEKFNDLISLEDEDNDLTSRCKFNFSYFDSSQDAGQDFSDWTDGQLAGLLEKIKCYTTSALNYWRSQRAGAGGLKVLEIYPKFPNRSDFIAPMGVPHEAQWGRFRLESKVRLVGFVIPGNFHNKVHSKTREHFDKNTFYVVFLDREHKFYITEKP